MSFLNYGFIFSLVLVSLCIFSLVSPLDDDAFLQLFRKRLSESNDSSASSSILLVLTDDEHSCSHSLTDPLYRLLSLVRWISGPGVLDCLCSGRQSFAEVLATSTFKASDTDQLTKMADATTESSFTASCRQKVLLFDDSTDPLRFEEIPCTNTVGNQADHHLIQYPLFVRELMMTRYQMKVVFHGYSSITNDAYDCHTGRSTPLELRWAHFRGNTRLVQLGELGDHPQLLIRPGEDITQYTRPGHLFVSMSLTNDRESGGQMTTGTTATTTTTTGNSNGTTSRNNHNTANAKNWSDGNSNSINEEEDVLVSTDRDDFANRIEFLRIRGLYMIPAVTGEHIDIDVDISGGERLRLYNTDHLFSKQTCLLALKARTSRSTSDVENLEEAAVATGTDTGTGTTTGADTDTGTGTTAGADTGSESGAFLLTPEQHQCLREAVMNYWDQQRFSQVSLSTWLVPAIPTRSIKPQQQPLFSSNTGTTTTDNGTNTDIDTSDGGGSSSCWNPAAATGPSSSSSSSSSGGECINEDEDEEDERRTSALWQVFDIPAELHQQIKAYHLAHRGRSTDMSDTSSSSSISRKEPPISLVFNQDRVDTRYVPLPGILLDALGDFVFNLTMQWVNPSIEYEGGNNHYFDANGKELMDELDGQISSGGGKDSRPVDFHHHYQQNQRQKQRQQWHFTGKYGCREYGHGAVVRWHTDPAESQPITAIVHIAQQQYSQNVAEESQQTTELLLQQQEQSERGKDSKVRSSRRSLDWAITVPKKVLEFGRKIVAYDIRNSIFKRHVSAGASINAHSSSSSEGRVVGGGASGGGGVSDGVHSINAKNTSAESAATAFAPTDFEDIFLREGQVLLLQSAKLPHARSKPYRGEWYANVFYHMAPVGWDQLPSIQALT